MTMSTKPRTLGAGEFKARCLRLLDEVATSGRAIVITKRGRPVAQVVPIVASTRAPLAGLIVRQGDLIGPVDETWDAER